jgi:ubiquinone biosynthesis protein
MRREYHLMKLTTIPQLAHNANRLREIVTILSKYGLADWLSRLDWDFVKGLFKSPEGQGLAKLTHETRIRLALSELGPTFIKVGQILSTRSDLIGPALAEELAILQDKTPADPPAVVRATIEAELGQPIEELFVEFEEQPLASASIAQVHCARLSNGDRVVVKVQHPGLETRMRTDLDILLGLAGVAEKYLPDARRYRPRTTAAEFQRMLLRELDFAREERNLQQFAANFAKDPTVRFPQPYPDLCTSQVLTMEMLEGIKIAEPERLRVQGHDLSEVARRGAGVFLEMIFRDGFYHADPHPGNILVLPGGIIGMLDCGMVGRLDEQRREEIEEMLLAIATSDAAQLTTLLARLGSVPPQEDGAILSNDVAEFVAYYGGASLTELDLAHALTELVELIRRHQIILPTGIATLLRVLIMLEGTSRLLSPEFSLIELLQPFQQKLLWRRLSPSRNLERWRRLYKEWEYLGEALPRRVVEILQQVQAGKLDVHLEHKRLEPSVNRLVLGLLTSALFLGSALLLTHQVPPLLKGVSILGALGCGLSMVLGLRLLWAIRKSGHLDR